MRVARVVSPLSCSRHIGALFAGKDEEGCSLLPFFQDTVQSGQRILLVRTEGQQFDLMRQLGEHGCDIRTAMLRGDLEVCSWEQLRKHNNESHHATVSTLLTHALASSAARGCRATQLWCDMAWASDDTLGVQGITEHEKQLTDIALQHDCSIVCAYDLTKLSTRALMEILRCHPMILAGGDARANPLWVAAKELAPERPIRGASDAAVGAAPSTVIGTSAGTVSELRRSNKDLLALSMLPATWQGYDAGRIIGRIAETLGVMLDAEFVCTVQMAGAKDEVRLAFTRSDTWARGDMTDSIRAAVTESLQMLSAERVIEIADVVGTGVIRVASAKIGPGDEGLLVVGACSAGFPTGGQRQLLRVAAYQAAISVQRWRAETQQHRFTTLVEKSSDFIGLASLDGTPQYINPSGLKLVGLDDMAQASQTHVLDFVLDEDRAAMGDEFWPVVTKSGCWRGELRFRHFKTGAAIPFLVDWFRIDDQRTGQPAAMATVSRDLTAQKRSEAEARHLADTLEQCVVVRTNALVELNWKLHQEAEERRRSDARLQELQSELYHAARFSAMGQMAGALAHELNQPLGAISNYVNAARLLLARATWEGSDRVRENIRDAAEQVQRAGRIIHWLREFVTAGETERQPENVGAMIEVASSLALVGAVPLGIEISLQVAPNLPLVFVDRIQVQQVLVNLMRNAIEAMADCERRELVLTAAPFDGKSVEIAVTDTGPGLGRNVTSRLFQPFVTSKHQGMGLGLSICHSIIEAHGGRLWHESRVGGGTIFRFTVPGLPESEDCDGQ
jgi:PAS domain S-box-containing protein